MSGGACLSYPFSARLGYLHHCPVGHPNPAVPIPFSRPLYNFILLAFLYLSMIVRLSDSLPWVYDIYQVVHPTDF